VSERLKWGAVAALLVAIVVAAVLHAYIGSSVADAKAEAVRVSAQKDREDNERRDAERAQQLVSTLAAIANQKQQPVNVEELAARITARTGTPITSQQLNALPDAPLAQKKISDYTYDCDSCKLERDSLRLAVANRDQQVADLKTERDKIAEQNAGAEKERDAAIAAEKKASGRGFVNRLKNCGLRIGVGALTGSLSRDGKYIGAGAAIGAGSCFF
jgi:hypothetical protein